LVWVQKKNESAKSRAEETGGSHSILGGPLWGKIKSHCVPTHAKRKTIKGGNNCSAGEEKKKKKKKKEHRRITAIKKNNPMVEYGGKRKPLAPKQIVPGCRGWRAGFRGNRWWGLVLEGKKGRKLAQKKGPEMHTNMLSLRSTRGASGLFGGGGGIVIGR